jgi:hypothetical protein
MTTGDDDSIRINYRPATQALSSVARGFGLGALVAGLGLMQIISVVLAFLFVVLLYWVSDLAYDVHWIVGAPIRILAFIALIGALFAALGAVIKILMLILFGIIGLFKSAAEQ